MGWSYRYRADDQLYADDEHGPTVFDPGAPISGGSGNVVAVGIPLLGQIATWTDATHIAGSTVIPVSAHPALTGDVVGSAGSTATTYNNPMPASKGGLPTGGAGGQILAKIDGTSYNTQWVTGGGNVSNVATPATGQLAIWTDAFHVQGITLLPAANHPALTGDVTLVAGTLITVYGNPVPPTKAGLPTGGSTGQVLSKVDNTNFNTSWINPPATGGNVSNSGAPQGGQIAMWTDATHIQGVNTLPTASAGTPPGGAAGEVLKKTTGTNFDYAWAPDISGSGGGTPAGSSGELQYNVAGAFAGVTKTRVVLPGTGTIAAAATGAAAGTTLLLAPGTFVENSSIELPNDVHMRGSGQGVSKITSTSSAFSPTFHGIVAPGNNSVIEDLSIIAVSPSGTGNENVNPISIRTGCTKSWTNVLIRNCHLYGLNDCIISVGLSLGDMTFVGCLLEAQCDVCMWQCASRARFYDCTFRHRVTVGHEGLSGVGLYAGDGFVEAYHCCYEWIGANDAFGEYIPLMSDAPFEVYDFVIDLRLATPPLPPGADLLVGSAGTMFISNVRRWDGKALKYYNNNPPVIIDQNLTTTIARLPASPTYGQLASVTDGAASLAYNATITGGGSTKYLVMWNNTNWIVLGGGTMAAGGADANYVHNQVSPSSSWAVTHNLGKFPAVSVVDSGNSVIVPDVLYTNSNQLTVSFGSATSGKAYLN